MSAQLRVVWEGSAPGLAEKRLSLLAFGPALNALLKAAKNVARRQVAAARGEEYDPETATKSSLVDLQVSAFTGGSADTMLEVVPIPSAIGGASLFEDFGAEIVRDLRLSLEHESSGRRRDRFVSEYLSSLPSGLTRQSYTIIIDGKAEEPLEIREMTLLELPPPPTALVIVKGIVEGVSFGEKGEPGIRFAPWTGKVLSLIATKAQVEDAVRLRHEKTQALVLMTARPRLMWVRKEDAPVFSMTDDERRLHFMSRWAGVLTELAK